MKKQIYPYNEIAFHPNGEIQSEKTFHENGYWQEYTYDEECNPLTFKDSDGFWSNFQNKTFGISKDLMPGQMTVQALIDTLQKIENKQKPVELGGDFRSFPLEIIQEKPDTVLLDYN